MRKHLPSTDLLNLGIEATTRPDYKEGMASKRVNYSLFPLTLDELREQCGVYGEAAVVNLQWRSVGVWLMNIPADDLLTHDRQIANKSVLLTVQHDRYRLGFPDWRGWERNPVLDDLDPQYRRVIEQVANDTREDWLAAGSPHLTANHIKSAYQYILTCTANMVDAITSKDTAACPL